jgi:phosphoglycolate phosphatase-like HAD superfamily hydrolase
MQVFFDFDDVLFNTRTFVAAMCDVFEQQGVSRDVFYETYPQARVVGNAAVKVYSVGAHIDILHQLMPDVDAELLRSRYDALFTDTSQYVFSDVREVLEDLKQQGAHIFVVSFGIEKVQRGKIEGSGLVPLLDGFFVGVEAKSQMIQPALDKDTSVWFIDDQPKFIDDVKTVFPFIKTIQMIRRDGRFTNERHPKSDFVVENMQEVNSLIVGHNV